MESYRSASLADWNPTEREMLIATRFGDTPQLHLVKTPAARGSSLRFIADAVGNGRFHPNGGDYIVFSKDIGGGEWYQLYRYDVNTRRRDDADRRQSAEFAGAVVVEGRSARVHVDAADGQGYGLVGDESGGSENGSSADATGGRRMAAAGLVTG